MFILFDNLLNCISIVWFDILFIYGEKKNAKIFYNSLSINDRIFYGVSKESPILAQ